jgi:hypothetical protein
MLVIADAFHPIGGPEHPLRTPPSERWLTRPAEDRKCAQDGARRGACSIQQTAGEHLMTGYTVHTGSTKKFSQGWDRVFKKSGGKKSSSGRKSSGAKRKK